MKGPWDELMHMLRIRGPRPPESKRDAAARDKQLADAWERVKFLDLAADSISRRKPRGER
jgi:hypothetical protein